MAAAERTEGACDTHHRNTSSKTRAAAATTTTSTGMQVLQLHWCSPGHTLAVAIKVAELLVRVFVLFPSALFGGYFSCPSAVLKHTLAHLWALDAGHEAAAAPMELIEVVVQPRGGDA